MNIKHLALAVLAGALLAVGCNKEEDPMSQKARIEASAETLTFEEGIGTQEFELTSTRDWRFNGYEDGVDWVTVTPESGNASVKAKTIEVTVKANTGHDRETVLAFTNGTRNVAVTVYQKGPEGPGGDAFSWSFESDLAGFTVETVASAGASWAWDSHKYAMAKGAKGTASDTYLVSPEIDLTNETVALLHVSHAAFSNKIADDCSVVAREVGASEWTKLTVPTWPTGWTFVDSGEIDLSAFLGKKIQIAFRYTCTTADFNTWEIQKASISREATPVYSCSSVKDIKAKADGSLVTAEGLTVAVAYKDGLLVTDGTDYMLVYFGAGSNPDYKVGDVINLDATVTYYGIQGAPLKYPQMTSPKNVTVKSTGASVKFPAAEDITSTFATFSIDPAGDYLKYYKVKATIEVSGNFVNFKVDGNTSDRSGSIIMGDKTTDASALNGMTCEFEGFFVYASGAKNQYITFLVTKIIQEEGYVNVSPANPTIGSEGGEVKLSISSESAWTVPAVSGVTIDKTSGTGNAEITVTVPKNEAFESREFKVVVKTDKAEATATIKQSAAADPSATVVELTNAEITAYFSANGNGSYQECKIGDWVMNAYNNKSNKFIQIRNSQASYIKTPAFEKEIAKIEYVVSATTVKRTLHVMPVDYVLPNKDKDDKYNSAANKSAFEAASLGSATNDEKVEKAYTIDVKPGYKQVMLCAFDGAMYINSIKVYLK